MTVKGRVLRDLPGPFLGTSPLHSLVRLRGHLLFLWTTPRSAASYSATFRGSLRRSSSAKPSRANAEDLIVLASCDCRSLVGGALTILTIRYLSKSLQEALYVRLRPGLGLAGNGPTCKLQEGL